MSFSHIVLKMTKAHYKKYIFYYLCNSFTVMFFFIFSTIYFNKQIVEVKETESIQYLLTIPSVSLIVFTVFFISYVHDIFIKQRKSEFALFMTLGLSNRNIAKLLLLENGVIAISSLVTGILSGILLSRIFFAVLVNFIGMQEFSFHLTSKMFIYTIICFLIVFLIAIGRSLFLVLKRDLVLGLKSNKVAETTNIKSPIIGGMGILLVFGSVLGLYLTYAAVGGEYLFLWISATLLGLYLCINQFTAFFIEIARKNKSYYYRRILFLSNLDYKIRQLTSTFMLVTVMVFITILYSTITLLFYMLDKKEALDNNFYDIAIMQRDNMNNMDTVELNSIIEQKDNPIQEHLSSTVYFHHPMEIEDDYIDVYTFMSLSSFNILTDNKNKLKDDEFIYFINDGPEYMDSVEYKQNRDFPIQNEKMNYSYVETIVDHKINNLENLTEIIVINDSQYQQVKENLPGIEVNIDLFNVANWQKTGIVLVELTDKLKKSTTDDIEKGNFSFQIASKLEDYERNKESNGILLFVTTILSIIFFFGSFILLYSTLVSDIEKEQDRYQRLRKIGVTSKEIKNIISKDIATLFFIPALVGSILAFLYIVAMAKDIGGIISNPEILFYLLIFTGSYFSIQIGFYLYARKKIPLLIAKKV